MIRRWRERAHAWARGLLAANLRPDQVGWAVGIGVAIGVQPLYGLHIGVCVLAARALGLNAAVMYAAANISNPFFAPFLVAIEIAVGEYIRHGRWTPQGAEHLGDVSAWEMFALAPDLAWSCAVGSQAAAIALAPPLGVVAWLYMRRRQRLAEAAA